MTKQENGPALDLQALNALKPVSHLCHQLDTSTLEKGPWADRANVQRIGVEAWEVISKIMGDIPRLTLPITKTELVRIHQDRSGFTVDVFEQGADSNGWPQFIHRGGFDIQGPRCIMNDRSSGCFYVPVKPGEEAAGVNPQKVCLSLTSPGTLQPPAFVEKIVTTIKNIHDRFTNLPFWANFSTHGIVELPEKVKLGVYPDTGGQVEYVLQLMGVLEKLSCRSIVINRGGYRPAADAEPHSCLQLSENLMQGVYLVEDAEKTGQFVPRQKIGSLTDSLALDAAKWQRGNKIDVLNAHYVDGLQVADRFRDILRIDVPLIFTPHSLGAHKLRNMQGRLSAAEEVELKQRVRVEQALFDHTVDYVFSTSGEIKDTAVRDYKFPAERIANMEPGFDPARFNPTFKPSRTEQDWQRVYTEIAKLTGRDEHELKFNTTFIVEASRTDKTKDKLTLIEAMKILRDDYPGLVLVLNVVEDPKSEVGQQLRKYVRDHNLQECVAVFKTFDDEMLIKVHALGQIYATTSTQEGFGMSLLNGAGGGKFCIFSNKVPLGFEYLCPADQRRRTALDGSAYFDIGPAGIMIPARNDFYMNGEGNPAADSLAGAIRWALDKNNSDQVEKMQKKAVAVAQPFTWENRVRAGLEGIGITLDENGKLTPDSFKKLTRRGKTA